MLDAQGISASSIPLDGFIVKETLAKDVLVHTVVKAAPKRVFTAADLWNIQRKGRTAGALRHKRSL